MLDLLKQELDYTYTENGARTYKSSDSYCLDLFATLGALRHADKDEIIARFTRAYAEDKELAMKILFFTRDIRGGLGERKIFNTISNYMGDNFYSSISKNIPLIPEYGRFDDLLALLGTKAENQIITYISTQLKKDTTSGDDVSLLAKWLPSINTSNKEAVLTAKKLAKKLNLSYEEYRKTLSSLRKKIKIIENNLREKDYTFDYSKQPSRAMLKYRSAFLRNDNARYLDFISKVNDGTSTINTGTLYPYDIVRSCFNYLSEEEKTVLDTTWNNLISYGNTPANALAVVDNSGSMYTDTNPRPCDVALSLGLYFAQHNTSAFANHFITFSENPQLIEIKGSTLYEKLAHITSFSEVANTNIQSVFDLILNTAIKNSLPQSELPKVLYIISDMEFDCCVENADTANFNTAKLKYESHGYTLPNIVFWNVASRNMHTPVKQNEQGIALVSGSSPSLFDMALTGELDPYKFMLTILNSERYSPITA